jgi:hypothetical protein
MVKKCGKIRWAVKQYQSYIGWEEREIRGYKENG